MAGKIYKFYQSSMTESWYRLSEAEQNAHLAKTQEALKKVGGKTILTCTPVWSNESWLICGVEEFPDVDAVQNYAAMLHQLNHYRYNKGTSLLGVKWPPA
jgi:peptidoglycan/xylan/chitin deacetylase (PgdA/CDA1 family)